MTTCPIDARPLERPPTGRPPTFCSVACRRVAEAELRRIDRRLAGLEVDLDKLDLDIASEMYGLTAKSGHKQRTTLVAAIATATARQRALYARLEDAAALEAVPTQSRPLGLPPATATHTAAGSMTSTTPPHLETPDA